MASLLNKKAVQNDDEEDIEKLRLAAIMSLGKKSSAQPSPNSTVIFQPHFGNPNLIAIIPEGAEPNVTLKHTSRQNFFRHPLPRPQQFRSQNSSSSIGTTLKVLPQVQIEEKKFTIEEKKENGKKEEKEEVSTKFSRFEDTESESDDESENEEIESESSEESEDVLALQDDDDSLEALMAQMEHEIEVGIDAEPNKKEKKKPRNIKSKEKDQKNKTEEKSEPEKVKPETKTAIVEPTVKGVDNNVKEEESQNRIDNNVEEEESQNRIDNNVKEEESQNRKTVHSEQERSKSPIKNNPVKVSNLSENRGLIPSKRPSPVIRPDSPVHISPESLPPHRTLTPPPRSPEREISSMKIINARSRSPRSRSPVIRATSPTRRKSPRRLSPADRRSPFKCSPDRYYSGKRSTSPYYKSRGRDYVNRSRSPVRRRSLSPRRSVREASPRYYQRRSRSPWSPGYRHSPNSPSRYVHRRSLSPRKKYSKSGYSSRSPTFWGSPKRRSPSVSPRRSKSPPRKREREYSPRRRRPSPRREYNYRRNSVSPKRNLSPTPKKYSPQRSPKQKLRSPSPRRNVSPRRKISPLPVKESRSKINQRSRTPSLSLSPSPPRELKGQARRYKSPLRPRREPADVSNRPSRARRAHSPEKSVGGEMKDKRKPNNKAWERERENRQWERKTEDKLKEKGDRTDRDSRKDRENNVVDKQKYKEPKEESGDIINADNPIFEARRKKFESTALVEPASKKIRLVSKRTSPIKEKSEVVDKTEPMIEEKTIVEHSVQTEDDLFSGHEEVDEIDNFLNEDVLDLSAEVWSSDDELFPKANKINKRKVSNKIKSLSKQPIAKEKSSSKGKSESRKATASKAKDKPSPPEKRVVQSRSPRTPSPLKKTRQSPELEQEERRDRDESDLRAELSRRREERLTKAGSLHEKLPARLLQSAFESALGTKRAKKEEKSKKNEKEAKSKEKSPLTHKEKSDGRRVLVLKRKTPVRMQSAHINVTFPKGEASESESSYSSSSSDERYSAPKRKLPVYMRLGTTQHKHSGGRKVKLRSRRSQV